MSKEDIKELVTIVGGILGLLVIGICLAIVIAIPTAAIVWIIEAIKG